MAAVVQCLTTWLPGLRRHDSLLGTAIEGAYRHLLDKAGAVSRPDTVGWNVTRLDSAPYDAPTADPDHRASHMASDAVGRLLQAQPRARAQIRAVFSTQCTLDQQVLASTCLRICHEHAPGARLARNFAQMGTAGLPTVLKLALLELQRGSFEQGLICLSAADKWIAPFYRHVPGFVIHADCAAACLLGPPGTDGVALIEAVETSVQPFPADLWRASATALREHLVELASTVVRAAAGAGPAPFVVGDGYLEDVEEAVSRRTGLPLLPREGASGESTAPAHMSSASPLFGLGDALRAATALGEPLRVVVWTASATGFAGALRVVCHPHAQEREGTWYLARAPHPLH